MTVKEFYQQISELVSPELSAPWDHDGLMLSPDTEAEVSRVLCALDVTEETVDFAIAGGFDLILSHHPFIFHPLSALTPEEPTARKAMLLLGAGISVISLHTRADAVEDGVNDRLAHLLGLEDVRVMPGDEEGIARIGRLPAARSIESYAREVKEILGAPAVLFADAGHPVVRVALCGGDGKDFVKAAIAAGADTYLSGRIGYHQMVDAPELGINMIEAGHYYTENHITAFLAELVSDILPGALSTEFSSGRITCV